MDSKLEIIEKRELENTLTVQMKSDEINEGLDLTNWVEEVLL